MNAERKLTPQVMTQLLVERGMLGNPLALLLARDVEAAVREQDEALHRLSREALQDVVKRNEIQSWFNVDKQRAALAALDARLNKEPK